LVFFVLGGVLMAKVKMTSACKRGLLARLDAAWTLTPERPVDVEVLSETVLRVTYCCAETGEVSVSNLLLSELRQQEVNNRA
jgi:hypothetical protein